MDDRATVNHESMLEEVLEGLQQQQKELPSKLFYDEKGSELFEQITYLDEYYLTRTERSILQENIVEIGEQVGPKSLLIELGSGSSSKTRLLFEKLSSVAAYVPVDISEEYLLKVVNNLRMEYPRISIIPVFADYTSEFDLPNLGDSYQKQLVFFPGSTIGNFRPAEARSFFATVCSVTDADSAMLIGVDLKKDKTIIEKAYNDEQGITAAFNKNILVRLNRELGTDFDIDAFKHDAFYNEECGRVEMHLVSQQEQTVTIAGEQIYFKEGESIHTENSYKYSLRDFEELVSQWYSVEQVWTDNNNYFSIQYLERK
ncbi:L-histidine N(alpha)-methyltransferase [Fodinibius saliphilus]|uniref:L-histidine N(alpha)-methyltransferase n=1 Tax=Fodinibius saliphilus TaxID=1920650 RepID=UPI001FE36FA9|nr:L-histidine N(alpha)-methyltransferase [Fodinibius saliphilus]